MIFFSPWTSSDGNTCFLFFFSPSPLRRTQSEQSQRHTHCIFQTWADFPPPNGASQQQPLAILLVLLAVRGTPPNTQAWGPLLSEGGEESHRGRCPGTRNGWSLGGQDIGEQRLVWAQSCCNLFPSWLCLSSFTLDSGLQRFNFQRFCQINRSVFNNGRQIFLFKWGHGDVQGQ